MTTPNPARRLRWEGPSGPVVGGESDGRTHARVVAPSRSEWDSTPLPPDPGAPSESGFGLRDHDRDGLGPVEGNRPRSTRLG